LAPSPRISADLAGTGGAYKLEAGDFRVEEVPAYLPVGEGPHTYLWIEKRGIDTFEAVTRLAHALSAPVRDVGYAGMKDRHAVTRQWISLPGIDPAAALAVVVPDVQVLEAARHGNKLKTGHLRGNRFEVAVRGAGPDALPRARAILAALDARGMPNFYGEQRFGRDGQNAAIGAAMLRGERAGRLDPKKARLFVSALQSELYNSVLEARLAAGLLRVARAGDLLEKVVTGGVFACTEPEVDQRRIEAWEIVPTAPMFGWKAARPPEGSAARAEEDAVLAARGVAIEAFGGPSVRRLAEGTRRAVAVRPGDAEAWESDGALWLRFSLPAGSYATVLLGEVIG
jgi:tRNA pseudouridine13 synthase